MKIKTIRLEHNNPSLNSKDNVQISLSANKETIETINAFLKSSIINNRVSLFEYLEAVNANNQSIINEVQKNAPKNPQNKGETISSLSFEYEGGKSIQISNIYLNYNLTEFHPKFTAFMVEKGRSIRHTEPQEILNHELNEIDKMDNIDDNSATS